MSNLIVKPVATRREKKLFLTLPWQLYRDDPNWIPPLRQNQKELVGYSPHPFCEENEVQTFLAVRDGRPCGRVAAILNNGHNRRYDEQRGFFGFFESIDDQEVASGLFDAVRQWFAERDIEAIRGPANPSLNYEIGTLIDGFDTPPTFMMTYNPPYHGRLIEGYGFRQVQDLFAYWGHVDMLSSLDPKLKFVIDEATRRFKVTTRRLDKTRFDEDVRLFLDIYNRSLGGTWGYVPLSEGEIRHMASSLKQLLVPEMSCIGEIDGKAVGAVFGMLDYNPRIKKINGRLFPFGFLRLLMNRRAIKRVRFISTNVVPEYQSWGLGLVLLNHFVPEVLDWGAEEVEFSWVLESNHLSRASLERGGAKKIKTFRMYDYGPE